AQAGVGIGLEDHAEGDQRDPDQGGRDQPLVAAVAVEVGRGGLAQRVRLVGGWSWRHAVMSSPRQYSAATSEAAPKAAPVTKMTSPPTNRPATIRRRPMA